MDVVPKLIFNELDEPEEESQRFLKFLEARLPGWHFQLLMKNGKVFFLGDESSLIREIRNGLSHHLKQEEALTHFKLKDGSLVCGMSIEALNADLIFSLAEFI